MGDRESERDSIAVATTPESEPDQHSLGSLDRRPRSPWSAKQARESAIAKAHPRARPTRRAMKQSRCVSHDGPWLITNNDDAEPPGGNSPRLRSETGNHGQEVRTSRIVTEPRPPIAPRTSPKRPSLDLKNVSVEHSKRPTLYQMEFMGQSAGGRAGTEFGSGTVDAGGRKNA